MFWLFKPFDLRLRLTISHTLYCIDGTKNPDDLGWDGMGIF